jgi:hypothetical protein
LSIPLDLDEEASFDFILPWAILNPSIDVSPWEDT